MQKKRKKREIVSEIYKLKFYVEKKKVPNILYCSKEQDNSELRLLGSWKASDTWKQTIDYTVPVS